MRTRSRREARDSEGHSHVDRLWSALGRNLTRNGLAVTSLQSLNLVDYTGRLFRDGKATISAELSGILNRLGTARRRHWRLEKLKERPPARPVLRRESRASTRSGTGHERASPGEPGRSSRGEAGVSDSFIPGRRKASQANLASRVRQCSPANFRSQQSRHSALGRRSSRHPLQIPFQISPQSRMGGELEKTNHAAA